MGNSLDYTLRHCKEMPHALELEIPPWTNVHSLLPITGVRP
jgi:hypothetical protein